MAGIFVQTVIFGATTTGIGLAQDLEKGPDRPLPLAADGEVRRADWAHHRRLWCATSFVVIVMLVVGLLVGFRPTGRPWRWLAAVGHDPARQLRLLVDLGDDRPAGAQRRGGAVGGLHLALPADLRQQRVRAGRYDCPTGCAASAEHQPVTILVDAVRELLLGQPVG